MMNIFAHRNTYGREIFTLNTSGVSIYKNDSLEFSEVIQNFSLYILDGDEELQTLAKGTGDEKSVHIVLEDMNTYVSHIDLSDGCALNHSYQPSFFFGKYALALTLSEGGYGVYFVNAMNPMIEILAHKSPNPTFIAPDDFMVTARNFLVYDDLDGAQAFIEVLESNEKFI